MKEQQHAQAHHKKYSKEDYQQQYQKQSSKQAAHSKNEQMHDHHDTENQGYAKKNTKNGEQVKSRSNNAGANNQDGYSGSYYGSRPMSQQSNVKSYYKNK